MFIYQYLHLSMTYTSVPAEIDNATSSGSITTTEGKTVKLTCEAKGIPVPTVTSYRNTLLTLTTQVRERKLIQSKGS